MGSSLRFPGLGLRFAAGFAVVSSAFGQTDEVCDSHRSFFELQLGDDGALGGVYLGVEAVFKLFFLCHYGEGCQRDGNGQGALQAVV